MPVRFRRGRPCATTALAAALLLGLAVTGPRAQEAPRPRYRMPATDNATAVPYGAREDVLRFADDLAERQPDLDADWLRAQLAQARYEPAVTRLIMPPPAGTAKNWAAYRARFIERERIAAGVAFWRANQAWLTLAEERWGVPPELIVGIVGVETFYGRIMGGFRTLDALATLAFDFPNGRRDRAPFFRERARGIAAVVPPRGPRPAKRASVRLPAPSACRNSCRAASPATASTSTKTAAST